MRSKIISIIASTILMIAANHAQASLLLVIDDNGQLTGANNVDVDGLLYDVEFLDGTCFELFSGCDELGDFAFQSEESATAASNALLDLVFTDGPDGMFDSDPELTNGCEDLVACIAVTVYNSPVSGVLATVFTNNRFAAVADDALSVDFLATANTLNIPGTVFAVWNEKEVISEVSAPSTIAAFALGLVALASRRLKKLS